MNPKIQLGPHRGPRGLMPLVLTLLVTVGAASCASGGGSGGERRGSANRLVTEDLAGLDHLDAYEAVRRLRPTWLQTRTGASPGFVLNGNAQMGGIDMMRQISVSEVLEIRFMNARDATTRFGTGYVSGAILVTTR